MVLFRCSGCGAALVTEEHDCVRLQFSQWRFFKDTGKLLANCRRCSVSHVLDAGTSGLKTDYNLSSVAAVRVREMVL